MASSLLLSSIALIALHIVAIRSADIACPFDPSECNCTASSSSTSFDFAECTSKNFLLPHFTGASGTYTIGQELDITFAAGKITTGGGFAPFASIKWLSLIQPIGPSPAPVQWAFDAFKGPLIENFAVHGVSGVIPPPAALIQLAPTLKGVRFYQCLESVSLRKDVFNQFTSLNLLLIQDTKIDQIDVGAFNGLEGLGELSLVNTNISIFPVSQLKQLTKIYLLDFTKSNIQVFDPQSFAPFTSLLFLNLDGNNIQAAISSGALLNIPNTTDNLWLANATPKLVTVPTTVLANAKQVTTLGLLGNGIESIKKGDFPSGIDLVTLELSDNPIAEIEPGALAVLEDLGSIWLTGSGFKSFDLSVLAGSDSLGALTLEKSLSLTSLIVSNVDQVPAHLSFIDLSATPLQYLDPKLETVITRTGFRTLKLEDVTTFDCNPTILWLAKYILCTPTPISAPNTRCATGSSLADYLASVSPADLCTSTGGTSIGTSTAGTGSTAPTSGGPTGTGTSATSTPSGPTGSGDTTTATPPPSTTTTKGAHSATANIILTTGMLLAIVVKFI